MDAELEKRIGPWAAIDEESFGIRDFLFP